MFKTIGVRGNLLLSFFAITGFAVLTTVAAIYSFLVIQALIDRITEQRMPIALAAQELSYRVERSIAKTPALLSATSPHERSHSWEKISLEIEAIDRLLLLPDSQGFASDTLNLLQNRLELLRANLFTLYKLVGERIELAEGKQLILDEMHKSQEGILIVLDNWITSVDNNVQRLHSAIKDDTISLESRSVSEKELIKSLTLYTSLQKTLQSITEIYFILFDITVAETQEDIDLFELRIQWSLESLVALSAAVQPQLRDLIKAEIERFKLYDQGEENIPSLRAHKIALISNSERVKSQNISLSDELTKVVEIIVKDSQRDIFDSTMQAHDVQRKITFILFVIVLMSLVSSILIVWLYVGRNLITRLTALSSSMLAIAGGNLRTPLPEPSSRDEIGQMAEALVIFRDTAIEVEENNLRDIEKARRRLVDAIENSSEGFVFFDEEDRLVICNTRYRELLHQDSEFEIHQGTKFETIVRAAAEKGHIVEAQGRVKEWVVERMALHQDPGEPRIQQRSSGQWILITERRTGDGGTVAIYSDITDLKQREEELTRKSNALEQLSNQLAKYLSPQVYDSIFSGKQEVTLDSKRKRLTVFFSDIIDFTKTTERLESEDLTHLLNQYLTEMSKIALVHGATIDKYVGDAIVIFFGDPETRGVKQDAVACVTMAIAMRQRMQELEKIWMKSGLEKPLKCRMGINTGLCTVGNFGSEDRMDYTIIGSGVNLASRLEKACPPSEILISYETYAHVRDVIDCQPVGQIEAKGFTEPVSTHRVIDLYENLTSEWQPIRAELKHVRLDIDVGSMTLEERQEAVAVLREALERLTRMKEGHLKRGRP